MFGANQAAGKSHNEGISRDLTKKIDYEIFNEKLEKCLTVGGDTILTIVFL